MTNGNSPDISQKEMAEVIFKLYQRRLISEDKNQAVNLQSLLDEPVHYIDNKYWFGLTEEGCQLWEEYAPAYSGKAIDWSNQISSNIDYVHREGIIEGTTEERVLKALEDFSHDPEWELVRDTIVLSKIDRFKAKYYKYIPGGFKVTFKLKKR